jgi:tetratricopeptide (TPR) repeat protein
MGAITHAFNNRAGIPHLLPVLLVAALAALVYLPALDAPFQFDDRGYIVENPALRAPGLLLSPGAEISPGLPENVAVSLRTRALAYLGFALNYRLHGLDPRGYRITSVAMHAASAMLIYALIALVMRSPAVRFSPAARDPRWAALAGAALFALHPLQTGAVVYISQRFAVQAALLYLGSVVCYLWWRMGRRGGAGPYALSLACALGAALSKEVSITLPAMVAALEFGLFGWGGPRRGRALALAPYIGIAALVPALLLISGETLDMASRTVEGTGRMEYLRWEIQVLATYLRLFVLPINQVLDYDYPRPGSFLDAGVMGGLAVVLGMLALAAILMRRGGAGRAAGLGILWFFIALAVESSVFPLADAVFEHRMYLPMAGLALAAGTGVGAIRARGRAHLRTAAVSACLVLVLMGALTVQRGGVWGSEVALWADTVAKAPGKGRARHNLGMALMGEGRNAEAARELGLAVALSPGEVESRLGLAKAYLAIGRDDEARGVLEEAVALSPGAARARNDLGMVYYRAGMASDALREFEEAAALVPGYANAQFNLGALLVERGETERGVRAVRRALEIDPAHGMAREFLRQMEASAAPGGE